MPPREMLFEGFTEEEILELPAETVEGLIVLGEPLVFRVGSATVLGSFKISSSRLVIELAQIEGGGEGVLVALASLARRYVGLRKLEGTEWIVHAVSCAKAILGSFGKMLEHRGFVVEEMDTEASLSQSLSPISDSF